MANKIKLGTFYMNNEILNPSVTTSYKNGTFISIDTNNSDENNKVEWVKVDSGSKHYLIATHNILSNISYNELSLQGLIKGVNVTLDGTKYILRVLSGGNTPRTSGDNYSKGDPDNNEWDEYICNEIGLTDLIVPNTKDLTGTWTDSDIGQSDSNTLWNWYKTQSICQELNSNKCTVRGGNSVSYIDNISSTTKNTTLGWRPILEKYNYNPIISDSDRNIGNYTMNIVKKYTVIDPEKELMEIKEYLDGKLLRTLPNVASDTEIQLTLVDEWEELSNSSHTIKIIVTDTFGNTTIRNWTFNKLSTTSGSVSSLIKPSIVFNANTNQVNPINANEDNDISFTVIGGDMVYHNELCITDNADSVTVVYDRKNTTFDFVHTIPSGSLTNGKEYQLKLRTYNENNQYSEWSNLVLMKTMSPISLSIENIVDGQVNTQNPLFVATYSQAENIKVSSYRYILYKKGTVIDSSDEIFSENIQYQFSGLENKETYTIQLIVKNVNGQEKIITQDFYCTYIQTRLNAILKTSMDREEGSVKLETYIRQIIGYLTSGDKVTYINGEEADLHNSVVTYDEDNCFYLDNDWTLQMWARDLEDNCKLIKIYNKYGYTILSKYKNVFFLSSYMNEELIYERYYSISGDIYSTDDLYFYIQYSSKNGFFNFEVKRVNNGKNTWFTPTHSEDAKPTYYNENGFLTNIGKHLKSIIIEKDNSLFRLPSIDDFVGNNRFNIYNSIIPTTDSNYDSIIEELNNYITVGTTEVGNNNIVGGSPCVVGTAIVGLSKVGYDTCRIVIKNNYSINEPLSIYYKTYNSLSTHGTTTLYLDGERLKTLITNNGEEHEINLKDIWEDITYEKHIITIEVSYKQGYQRTRSIEFKKGESVQSKFEDKYCSFYTSSKASEKLYGISSEGSEITINPCEVIGNRYIIDLPLNTYVTKNVYNRTHIIKYSKISKSKLIQLKDLGIGEKVKDYRTNYKGKPIEFTIARINNDSVTLISDIICLKEFDSSETTKINGNNDWELSNIKQWLNNNEKLVES